MKDIFLLDMDETLLDFTRAERENLSRTLAQFGVCCDDRVYARFHEINDGLWKLLERGGIARSVLIVRRFELLFDELGVSVLPGEVAKAYFDGFPELCFPYEGAAEFLKTLAARGRVYLVTNGGTRIQRRHMELAGFLPYLSGAFISEEVGADKPSMEYAEAVAAQIEGFSRERAVWIGDSLTSDMVCAERLGVDFILFAHGGVPEGYTGKWAADYGTLIRML